MEKIPTNEIVNFIFNLIFTNENNKISEQMENCLLNFDFEEDKNENELYIFKNSKTLKQFVALIHACYIIHLHLCIIGPTGVGKTSSTKKISELIQNKKKDSDSDNKNKKKDSDSDNKNKNYEIFCFNKGSKSKDFYGTLVMKNNNFIFDDGPLTFSIKNGNIFIADEMNNSLPSTMKSLEPVLDSLLIDEEFYIPGVEIPLIINENFFFIACQNDIDYIGRNIVPYNLQRRLKNIKYPEPTKDEIKNICKDIRNCIFKDNENCSSFTENNAEQLGVFMIRLKKLIKI